MLTDVTYRLEVAPNYRSCARKLPMRRLKAGLSEPRLSGFKKLVSTVSDGDALTRRVLITLNRDLAHLGDAPPSFKRVGRAWCVARE
jgi:hypothetical protein